MREEVVRFFTVLCCHLVAKSRKADRRRVFLLFFLSKLRRGGFWMGQIEGVWSILPYLSLRPTVHRNTPPKATSSPKMTADKHTMQAVIKHHIYSRSCGQTCKKRLRRNMSPIKNKKSQNIREKLFLNILLYSIIRIIWPRKLINLKIISNNMTPELAKFTKV